MAVVLVVSGPWTSIPPAQGRPLPLPPRHGSCHGRESRTVDNRPASIRIRGPRERLVWRKSLRHRGWEWKDGPQRHRGFPWRRVSRCRQNGRPMPSGRWWAPHCTLNTLAFVGGTGAAPMRKPRKIFIVLGMTLATLLAVLLFRGLTTKPGHAFPSIGTPAPAFSIVSTSGMTHVGTPTDGGGSGKPVALLFFGAWCSLCHSELPPLAAAVHSQESGSSPLKKVAVVGVDSIDSISQAAAFCWSSGVPSRWVQMAMLR